MYAKFEKKWPALAHTTYCKKIKSLFGKPYFLLNRSGTQKIQLFGKIFISFSGLIIRQFWGGGGGGDSKLLDNLLKWQIACGCRLVVPLATKVSIIDFKNFDDLSPSIVIGRLWLLLKFVALAGNCLNILWVTSDS